jgi:hypothetical protein
MLDRVGRALIGRKPLEVPVGVEELIDLTPLRGGQRIGQGQASLGLSILQIVVERVDPARLHIGVPRQVMHRVEPGRRVAAFLPAELQIVLHRVHARCGHIGIGLPVMLPVEAARNDQIFFVWRLGRPRGRGFGLCGNRRLLCCRFGG